MIAILHAKAPPEGLISAALSQRFRSNSWRMALGLTVGFVLATLAPALAQRSCGSNYEQQYQDATPATQQQMTAIEQQTQRYQLAATNRAEAALPIITIPVVVHVVYNTLEQNVSQAQIQAQIDVLTQDFRLANTDQANIPAPFRPLAADFGLQFALATVDPTGNPTTGITRTFTTTPSFSKVDNPVKFNSSGGHDAWPSDRYLNVWVCNLSVFLGYASFPGEPAATDGVVVRYSSLPGGSLQPYDKGRTATHEVGHWLNLRHIWGDTNCGNDLVDDTPTQQASNLGCPSFPRRTCGNTTHGDMFMNYMDYTDDRCMFMFTRGQRDRAQALFVNGGPRQSFAACPNDLFVSQPVTSSGRYKASSTVTGSSSVSTGLEVVYQAGNGVTLSPGFFVNGSGGGSFKAVIADCSVDGRPLSAQTGNQAATTGKQSTLAVYPNPVSEELYVLVAQSKAEEARIYNSLGSQVQCVSLPPGQTTVKVDVRRLSAGMYYLQTTSASGVATARFQVRR
jgi:hypothetical protein